MRRTITSEVLKAYKDDTFTLSRRRILTLGFGERIALENNRIKVHPLTWRTYTECLTKWQSCGMRSRSENASQRRQRQRFYNSISK